MVSFYPIRARRSSNHPWWDCETGQSASPGLWRGKIEKKVYALAGEEGGSEIDAECGFLHPTDVLGQIKGMGGTGERQFGSATVIMFGITRSAELELMT